MTATPSLGRNMPGWLATWWPVVLGFCALYIPTIYSFSTTIWSSEDQAHGPLILLVVLYLFWDRRHCLELEDQPRHWLGWPLFIFGLLLYVLGRSQDIMIFEMGSLMPVTAGVLLITKGMKSVRAYWFALFFILFLVPLPGFFVDALTGSLKQQISIVAENVLYAFGYPIARSGVNIMIGPYQLLVAEACSGLHSMFSLSALGMLYLYLVDHKGRVRNGIIVFCILPIAFVANVMRVIALILVTYYFGDEAGQGFTHLLAGIILFSIALTFIVFIDNLLQGYEKWQIARRTALP